MISKKISKSEYNLLKALSSIMPKKSTGGELLSFGSQFLPFGQFLSPAIGMVDSMIDKQNQLKNIQTPMPRLNTNTFGNLMANGGVINNNFKQYNTGGHITGNDLPVDQNGNASANPVAAVQNKENMFKIKGTPFIMSDTLVNPETGKTFNVDAAKLNKKYPDASFSTESKNTLNLGMERLAKLNNIMKGAKETYQMMCGGSLKKYADGGPFIPRRVDINGREYNYITDAPQFDPLREPIEKLPQAGAGIAELFTRNQSVPTIQNPLVSSTDDRSYSDTSFNQGAFDSANPGASGDSVLPTDVATERTPFNFNSIAVGLKGAGLLKSILDASTPAQKESPLLPDYTESDRYMAEANIDYTQARQNAIGASNVGANVNRSASGNFSQYLNREANRVANLSDSIANIDMAENNARSNLNLSRAQYKRGNEVDRTNRLYQNRIDNQQNQATADLADQKLFSEISQVGSEFNKYQNFREQIANNKELQNYYVNEALALINSQNANFQLDPAFVEKLKSGNYTADDVVKVVNMTGLTINDR